MTERDDEHTLDFHHKKRPFWQRILLWRMGRPRRWLRYGILGLLMLGGVWSLSMSYILFSPVRYTSEWTLILPGTGAGANVNLPEVGQIASSSTSAYSSHDLSPKVNYQTIATSPSVLQIAAAKLDVPVYAVDKPSIKLIPQTSLLLFKTTGNSPEQTRDQALALHEAFLQRLDELRDDEIQRRDEGVAKMLQNFTERLELAREHLAAFQMQHHLISADQSQALVSQLQALREKRDAVDLQLVHLQTRVDALQTQLHLSPEQVADALLLRNDALYMEYQTAQAKAQAEYAAAQAKWGAEHPELKNAEAVALKLLFRLQNRARQLLGKISEAQRERLGLEQNGVRAQLYQSLIEQDIERQALQAEVAVLRQQQLHLEQQLSEQIDLTTELTRLQRKQQIAEAAFSSALVRIDASKSDIYATYPLLQVLEEPNLPERPSAPKKKFALIGAIAATLFTCIGLFLLWIRTAVVKFILD